MKLIDLLVQELPKRGGWPDGASFAVQDTDRTVKFAKTLACLHYLSGEWQSDEDGYDWIYKDRPFDGNFVAEWTADDNHRAIISMSRYECEISKNKTGSQAANKWNGEGLPPVGCECEVSVDGGRSWCTYRAINEKNGVRLIEIGNLTEEFQNNNWIFRQLRTEAERKRDAAIEAMQREADEGDAWVYSEYEIIYDAIAAGKIPGVKLDD